MIPRKENCGGYPSQPRHSPTSHRGPHPSSSLQLWLLQAVLVLCLQLPALPPRALLPALAFTPPSRGQFKTPHTPALDFLHLCFLWVLPLRGPQGLPGFRVPGGVRQNLPSAAGTLP